MNETVKTLLVEIRTSIVALVSLVILTGAIYPVLVWAVGQTFFQHQANGSLVTKNGKLVGSALISQKFNDPGYFFSRPSSAGTGYDASSSSGSNLGPTSQKLMNLVSARADSYRRENGLDPEFAIPVDAVTASGSGLDPDISLENALIQARRVARIRSIDEEKVVDLVKKLSAGQDMGLFGQPRVNVLEINLIMDGMQWR